MTGRTTNSVSISWQHDRSTSYSEKWKVEYTEKGKGDTKNITTKDVNQQEVTIPTLTPGLTYSIKVSAVTTNDVLSQTAAEKEATVSKYS